MSSMHPSSYEELMRTWHVDVPPRYNFAFDFVDTVAATDPQRLAMIHVDDAGVRREYTMGYFAEQSSRMANALAGMGIGRGDTVMIIVHRRVEFWVLMLALHKLGALGVPSPALLTAHDIVYRVQTAEIKGIVADASVQATVEAAMPQCPTLSVFVLTGAETAPSPWKRWEDVAAAASAQYLRPADAPGGDDPATVFFSSGTTGYPRMVLHTFTYPLGHMVTGKLWHDLRPGDVHLTVADTGWAKSVWGKFYGQWLAGATVFVWDYRGKFDPSRLLSVMAEHRVTTFCAPPTIYRFLVREDLSRYDLSALRHCTTAGELLNDSVFHEWKEKLGLSIFEGYGQTETTLQIATFPCMEPKPGSIGKPAPGWDIVLLDETGEVCPPGVEGEICVRLSPRPVGLFREYWKAEDKTANVMEGGVYHTGDKAWVDEDGYFWFLGRVDDLIKSSGYRIGPFEVESALVSHPAVVEAAVTGVPDPDRGQAVKASVVLASGYTPSPELTRELQNHVKKVTAPYKYPRIVEYVTELPKTISGKIKRAEIRARDAKNS
ncbi:MAG: AMP-dependent synthetase and ligase [Desulfomicrobiaceae bacterium]|jgi:acetyl-CoA synthetase|nr:AMP-binding protein [Desulfomicrobiaceae bacterium]MBZ4684848.1 AMP-dependent synthetase and ligase [Desulfomicrobiaceae bacterium]HCF05815.1 acyl-CoA synthetase [Desulfomicrobiaceae bacterium]